MYGLAKRIRPFIGNIKIGQIIEKKIINNPISSIDFAPIFIIGLPRSGSTLLYQLIAHYFKTSYFSNLASLCYTYPVTATYIARSFQKKYKIKNFESNFGFTSGMFAPSEAGAIYRYWFYNLGQNHEHLKSTCHKISDILKAPFVWKNLHLSYQIDNLSQMFPNCLVVLIERDLQYICQSAYTRTVNGPGLGIKGLTKNELTKSSDVMQSVVMHIRQAYNNILNSIERSNSNVMVVQYTELCDDYKTILDKISKIYNNIGYVLQKKSKFSEQKFTADNYKKLSDQEWKRLIKLLENS